MKKSKLVCLSCILAIYGAAVACAEEMASPTLNSEAKVTVTSEDRTLTVTFGPVDVSEHEMDHTAGAVPPLIFVVPKDLSVVSFKASVFDSNGNMLPRKYLHHIALLNLDKKKLSCPGASDLIAGGGLEMIEAKFPPGYGLRLNKGTKVLATAAFYHRVPPQKGVMAKFTMELAPENLTVMPLEVYQISVNEGCYSGASARSQAETDEGISILPGLQFRSVPVRFLKEGCVKFSYPHGHDHLVLMTLENKSAQRTVFRTMPNAAQSGDILGFPPSQVYSDSRGFGVNAEDEYEMTMLYHRPLQDIGPRYGMAIYVLYMALGKC